MAKYFIEDTTLTAMADKIRALTGTTGTLTPTQMTTEVQSAKEDVDSAMDALETLGIIIPEGSDIGDLAGLVGEVEAGGGVETCTVTITNRTDFSYSDLSLFIYAGYVSADGDTRSNVTVGVGESISIECRTHSIIYTSAYFDGYTEDTYSYLTSVTASILSGDAYQIRAATDEWDGTRCDILFIDGDAHVEFY